jgi:NADH-quinone oxidoreductase subunit A
MGIREPAVPTQVPPSLVQDVTATEEVARAQEIVHDGARQLMWVTIVDIAAFFAVLLIGFAYVWKRGDLDWVRAVGQERAEAEREFRDELLEEEQVLSA